MREKRLELVLPYLMPWNKRSQGKGNFKYESLLPVNGLPFSASLIRSGGLSTLSWPLHTYILCTCIYWVRVNIHNIDSHIYRVTAVKSSPAVRSISKERRAFFVSELRSAHHRFYLHARYFLSRHQYYYRHKITKRMVSPGNFVTQNGSH